MILLTFLIVLTSIVLVGLNAARRTGASRDGYYLARSSSPPWLTAIAAVATLNSGYLFTGLIGFTYVGGLQTIWLTIGWIIGDFIASLFVYKQIRFARDRSESVSFSAVLGTWHGKSYTWFRKISAVLVVLFLTAYATAQISAGAKTLFATIEVDMLTGTLITVGLVIGYGALGGMTASMWANALQAVLMLIAMFILVFVGISHLGGMQEAFEALSKIDGYLQLWPSTDFVSPLVGGSLFIMGWVFAGLSVVGQPHIMTIYMTLESPEKIRETRWWYYSFYILLMALATVSGLIARVILPELSNGDPELALSTMARLLLPSVLVGIILAGIFSATLSTIDSLVLAGSAAIADETPKSFADKAWKRRMLTAVISIAAFVLSLNANQTVFSLVILSWSILGSAFGPILILYALGRYLTEARSILIMLLGAIIVVIWRAYGLQTEVYEGFPAICSCLVIGWVLSSRRTRMCHDR